MSKEENFFVGLANALIGTALLVAVCVGVWIVAESLAEAQTDAPDKGPPLTYRPRALVRMFAIEGNRGLSAFEARRAASRAQEFMRDAGFQVRIRAFRHAIADPCAELSDSTDEIYERFHCYKRYFAKNYRRNHLLTYVFTPPTIANGRSYLGGYATAVCAVTGNNFAVGAATMNNLFDGAPRFEASAGVAAHELGHLLGGAHDSSNCNIMHPAAGSECWTKGTGFSWNQLAINQMGRCFKRRGTWGYAWDDQKVVK